MSTSGTGHGRIRTASGKLPDNVGIAVYALRILGGAARFVHGEDVALKCFELVPERFSWRKYPQYPDAAPARFALEDAKKAKYGSLASGNRTKGWKLTPSGVNYAEAVRMQVETLSGQRGTRSRGDRQGFRDVENHGAYSRFLQTNSVDTLEFHELTTILRCPVDTPHELLRDRLQSLGAKAKDGGRSDIVAFLEAAAEKFANEMGGSGE
jgi:hypothetical protein